MTVLGIIIVNYNSTDFLARCLESIHGTISQTQFHVTVVDNASVDQNFDGIRNRYPKLDILQNDQNLGFSTACNRGVRNHPARFYLLLNPDCIVENEAIDKTVAFLESTPDAGIVGCRVNHPDGSLQLACRRSIPRPSVAFYRFSGLSLLFPRSRRFGAYNLSYLREDEISEVEAVSGSYLMFRDEILKTVGALDERFFLYGEDLDFCLRATQSGWKVYYFPEAQVTHFKRASSSREVRQSNYHFYKAMEIFYRKHFYSQANLLERFLVLGGIRLLHLTRLFRSGILGEKEVGSKY